MEFLQSTFDDFTDIDDARKQLNEILAERRQSQITEITFNSPEDIIVRLENGQEISVYGDFGGTTMEEILEEIEA